MKFVVLAAVCGVLLSPAASMASEGAAPATQPAQQVASNAEQAKSAEPAAPAKAKKEKKVCHRFGASESRLGGGSVCKTQAEWDAMKGSTVGSAADR